MEMLLNSLLDCKRRYYIFCSSFSHILEKKLYVRLRDRLVINFVLKV